MRAHVRVLNFILLAGLFLSCDETFNPNGLHKPKMVVYAVMSTESDTQYVRVYATYPVASNPPSMSTEPSVSDAQVTITQGTTVFSFRDTTLQRADTSRYRSAIKAYVAYGLRLEAGSQYLLTVVSPSFGRATASGVGLYRGVLITETDPYGNFLVRVFPGSNVRAFILRRFLEYQVRVDTTWITKLEEVPRAINSETGELAYQRPVSRTITSVSFSASGYDIMVSRLRQRFPVGSLRLNRSFFRLTQLDDALYAYYSTANGFPDSGTLRLDEPDYTNINGGLGVFALTSTTVVAIDTAAYGAP
jgi:hypothetical protein